MNKHPHFWINGAILSPVLFCLIASSYGDGGRHPWRGLWIGEASLDHATRVVSVVGDNNVRNDPDPGVPEPTADRADIRLILHVNAAGQASLLKGVAILDRTPTLLDRKDIALVTDASLYSQFDNQFARRVASAAFDFGEVQAVNLIDEIIEVSASAATAAAVPSGTSLEAIKQATTNALNSLSSASDVNGRFTDFLTKNFADPGSVIVPVNFAAVVDEVISVASATAFAASAGTLADIGDAIRTALDASPVVSDGSKVAGADDWPDSGGDRAGADGFLGLKGATVFKDSRGVEAIGAVVEAAVAAASEAAAGGGTGPEIEAATTRSVEWVIDAAIDLGGSYNNFIGSRQFLDLEQFAAEAATRRALEQTGDAEAVATALRQGDYAELKNVPPAETGDPDPGGAIRDATATALVLKTNSKLGDDRATLAVNEVLEAAVVASSVPAAEGKSETEVFEIVVAATAAAVEGVTPGVVSTSTPSNGYNQYLKSADFASALTIAASTAAGKAFDLKGSTGAENEVVLAVSNALQTQQSQAARVPLNEVDLVGEFEPGGSVEGNVILPANHPTNPFRHRRHNLNTTGFNIERVVTLTLRTGGNEGAQDSEIRPVGRGLHRVEGTYKEEVFGLHKNLGSDADQPVGLTVSGTFTLHRVSLVDALNVRTADEL